MSSELQYNPIKITSFTNKRRIAQIKGGITMARNWKRDLTKFENFLRNINIEKYSHLRIIKTLEQDLPLDSLSIEICCRYYWGTTNFKDYVKNYESKNPINNPRTKEDSRPKCKNALDTFNKNFIKLNNGFVMFRKAYLKHIQNIILEKLKTIEKGKKINYQEILIW